MYRQDQLPFNFDTNDSLLGSDLAVLPYIRVREQKHIASGMRPD